MTAAPASMPSGSPPLPVCPISVLPKKAMPASPKGANGCRLAGLTKKAPTAMTNRTIASLTITMKALNLALSLMPFTRTTVRMKVIRIAGRSKYEPVETKPVVLQSPPTLRQ